MKVKLKRIVTTTYVDWEEVIYSSQELKSGGKGFFIVHPKHFQPWNFLAWRVEDCEIYQEPDSSEILDLLKRLETLVKEFLGKV
jgi:hypothetical protein